MNASTETTITLTAEEGITAMNLIMAGMDSDSAMMKVIGMRR